MRKSVIANLSFIIVISCLFVSVGMYESPRNSDASFVVVLGIAQDAGFPQAGCEKECCAKAWEDHSVRRHISSIAVVDPVSNERWIFDCTPDFREQLRMLDEIGPALVDMNQRQPRLAGIFLTHAHIGHYTGLMFLGHESIDAKKVPTYVMPRMKEYLSSDGPWSQLVEYENVKLIEMEENKAIKLNSRVTITPFRVPHREEYSEVVGFKIEGPTRSALFIPDIDKWTKWDELGTRIEEVLSEVDIAYLDGTFYANGEIPNRDMSQIPHPFIKESMVRFASLPESERNKIHFIHMNHTNPALDLNSKASADIEKAGLHVAEECGQFSLGE